MKNTIIVAACFFIMYQDFGRVFQMREGSHEEWQRWESIKGQVGRFIRGVA